MVITRDDDTKEITPFKDIMQILKNLSYEEALFVLCAAQCAITRNVIKEEIQSHDARVLKATCPPEFWKTLQKEFPDIKSYKT